MTCLCDFLSVLNSTKQFPGFSFLGMGDQAATKPPYWNLFSIYSTCVWIGHNPDTYMTRHLALYTYALQTEHVCFWSINNYGHCKWTAMYLLAVSHIPMEQFSKKIYTSHSLACILASVGGIFVKIHSLHTLHVHNKWYGLDVISKKLFAFYLMSNMPSRLYISFHQWDFSENPHLALHTHSPQTVQVWLSSINN
jgi:hypothetical protein